MNTVSRRDVLKGTGALVVSFALTPGDVLGQALATLVGDPSRDLDGWLSIAADGSRHGLHRQMRDRAGPLHRADAARRRGALRAGGAGEADSMPDRHDARPGRHVRRAVASAEFQPRESRARRRDRARGAAADGVEAFRRAGRSAQRARRRRLASGAPGDLRRADRRPEVQRPAQCRREAASSARVDGARDAGQASRHARDGDRPARVRAQRARARNGARPRRPSADRRRNRRQRRPPIRQRHAGLHQGRDQRTTSSASSSRSSGRPFRPRTRSRSRGSPAPRCRRRPTFYDHMRRQPSRDTLLVDSKDVDARLASAATGRARDLPASVSQSRIDRRLVRRRGCEGRPRDHLVAHAGRVSAARQLRAAARPAEGTGEGDLHARLRLLRHQRRRYGFV